MEAEILRLKTSLDSLQTLVDSLQMRKYIEDETVVAILEGNEDEESSREPQYSQEVSDSLLAIWYKTTSSGARDFDSVHDYNMDSVRFTSNVSDSLMVRRLSDMNSYITLPFNETVKNYMVLYSERMPSRMGRVIGLSQYYFPIIEQTLVRYNLPQELKYMAVIESMLNPTATSRAGARGMWQFMYRTARIYGLTIDSFVDERLDVERAIDAAARYLRDAYKVFGDWSLAISSYNCGAGNVSKAIRRSGGSNKFWDIYPFLPRETRGYVPAFVGAMYAMTYFKEYGIVPQEVGMPAQTDTIQIRGKLHFRQINEVVGVPMEDLQNLNPQYIREIIPGKQTDPCILNLPFNWTSAFLAANRDSLYNHKLSELMGEEVLKAAETRRETQRLSYKVRNGDYLGRIATRYGVSVSDLKKWNHLRSSNIRVGQILYIYKNGGYIPPKSSTSSKTSASSAAKSSSPGATTKTSVSSSQPGDIYIVKSGDSFYSIAKNYPGVSAQNIMDYNGMSSSSLRPGMKLRIPKP